jgi:hypothetical protein
VIFLSTFFTVLLTTSSSILKILKNLVRKDISVLFQVLNTKQLSLFKMVLCFI